MSVYRQLRVLFFSTGLVGLLSLIANNSFAFEVRIDAIQDTYVHQANASSDFSGESTLLIKKSNSGAADREAYFEFDISSVPRGVDSVYFRVGIESSATELEAFTYEGSWNDGTTNWNNKLPTGDFHSRVPELENDYVYIDLTDTLNDYRDDRVDTFTLILRSRDVTSSSMSVASIESSTSFLRPRIYFDDPDSEDPFAFDISYSETEKGSFAGRYLASSGEKEDLSSYGGWQDWNLGASGFFRLEQIDGAWFLVDPDGYVFYNMGINSVEQGGGVNLPGALKDVGLNSSGSFTDDNIGLPRTPRLNFLRGFKNSNREYSDLYDADILPVFYDEFESFADQFAQELISDRNDPSIIGIFSDNELVFHRYQLAASLGLPTNNPQYQAADRWMVDQYGGNYSLNDITDADEEEFSGVVAERYYKVVSEAIKRYDSNHLYLGSRIHAAAKRNPDIIAAAGKYVDVISINNYGDWEPRTSEGMDLWYETGGKPFMITEWYTKASDSGLSNSDGAGWLVETQQDRANFFENFVITLMSHPGSVGWHWFRYIDNNDSNKGLFNEDLDIYETLAQSFTKINTQAYRLRGHLLWDSVDYNGRADGGSPSATIGGGNDNGSNGGDVLNRSGWSISASNNSSDTKFATDGNTGTRWSTGQSQRDEQWILLDIGKTETFSEIELDSDSSDKDYPRQYVVSVSANGSDFDEVAQGTGSNSTESIRFDEVEARYVRIEQVGSDNRFWWSIHEMNLLR